MVFNILPWYVLPGVVVTLRIIVTKVLAVSFLHGGKEGIIHKVFRLRPQFSYLSDVRYNFNLVVSIDFTSLNFAAKTRRRPTELRGQNKHLTFSLNIKYKIDFDFFP